MSDEDGDNTNPLSVPKSDVRFNCPQCTHKFTAINHALQGADYNTPITSEVIYTIDQSGFTQLYINAMLVAELLGAEEHISFPNCQFPKCLAVLLFDLINDDIINEDTRRDQKVFITIMLKEHKFKSKLNDLSGCIAKVSGIKWNTFGTTKCYAFSFYEIIEWYSRCKFFNSTFCDTKDKRCLSIHFIKQPSYFISSKMI